MGQVITSLAGVVSMDSSKLLLTLNLTTISIMSETHEPQIPPDIDQALSRLAAYRNVRGVMILIREPLGIVKSSGPVFEGEAGKKYAKVVESIVTTTARGIAECEHGVGRYVRTMLNDRMF
jgi:hypothetical protein